MACRICGSASLRKAGEVEYITGFAWPVLDCDACGCRFTRHDPSVHNLLHQSGAISYYQDYRVLAAESRRLFDRRDGGGLKSLLSKSPKYRFVIHELEHTPDAARLLEVGCSRGYLTSWFIHEGRNILGVDVSPEAVEGARAAFGDHFALADSPAVTAGAPYDAIYHLGMIGCVSDPIGLTKQLLSLLKPGGRLLFNAPNRAALRLKDQLWFDSAPPPDVVTLFPPGFWIEHFGGVAVVREGMEFGDPNASFVFSLRRLFGRGWQPPEPLPVLDAARPAERLPSLANWTWRWWERSLGAMARRTGLSRLVPQCPTEFGLYVKMTPHATATGVTAGPSLHTSS